MSDNCGGENVDVIAELTDEQERICVLGRELTLAARADDQALARQVAGIIRDLMRPHHAIEEDALFPVLADELPDETAALAAEHEILEKMLAGLDTDASGWSWPDTACDAVNRLLDHVHKEQERVFPAARSVLGPDDWERVVRARSVVSERPDGAR